MHKKVSQANAKGKERVSVQWCDVNDGATVATWQSDHGMWDENLGGRIRSCRARSPPPVREKADVPPSHGAKEPAFVR